ncbi:MAG: response regulator [Candidatus Gorgyraea atricola]|nr:response regulator [Candidatus Gorgyraea atricola]
MSKRILIVDDEKVIALTLKDLFVSKGYEVSVVFSGQEAIKYLNERRFDLILLDIQIPDVDGLEVLKVVREAHPDVKTVMLSGFLDDYKEEIEKIGCDAVLNKPFSVATLASIVETTLSRKKYDGGRFSELTEDSNILTKARLLFIEPNKIMYSPKLAYFQDKERCKGMYQLDVAFTKEEVLKKIKTFKPNIVLSDIGMFRLYDLAERFTRLPEPPKDVILYGMPPGAEDKHKTEGTSFIGGLFDPATLELAPEEMDKLGRIVRATAIMHNLYVEPERLEKKVTVKKRHLIGRKLIFWFIFTLVFFGFISAVFHIQQALYSRFDWARHIQLVAVLIIVFSIRPLEWLLVRLTDRFLFQKRFSYERMLVQASSGMVLITDLQKLINLIARIVKKYMRSSSVCIFLYDEKTRDFVLRFRRGDNQDLEGCVLGSDHPVPMWLKREVKPLLYTSVGVGEKKLKRELRGLGCQVCMPSFWNKDLTGFLILGEKFSGDPYTSEEISLLSTLSNEVAIAIENAKNFLKLENLREKEKKNHFETVLALAKTVDEKDSYTRGHLDEVTKYGMIVANELPELQKSSIDMEELKVALLLHDIGKIGVPDAILNKKKKLSSEEWGIMKQHCDVGARIVEPVARLRKVAVIIKHHQEKYDGSGYPDGLKAEEIPIESRIIAVVDAYHAMVSDRPYRKALPGKQALKELKDNVGTQFDPAVVEAFFRAWKKGKIKKRRARR